MNPVTKSWLVVLGFLIALSAPAAERPAVARATEAAWSRLLLAEADLPPFLRTDHYGVYVQNKRVGFSRASLERVATPAGVVYRSTDRLNMKVTAIGVQTTMDMVEVNDFEARPPFRLVGGSYRINDGKSTKEIRLVPAKGGFDVTVVSGGDVTHKTLPSVDYTLADVLTPRLWIRRRPAAGDRLTSRSFDMDDLKTDQELRRVTAVRRFPVKGATLAWWEVGVTMPKDGMSGVEVYAAPNAELVSMKLAGLFDLRAEPEAQTRRTRFSDDLFVLGAAKVDRPLGPPTDLSELVLEVHGPEVAALRSGPRQSVTQNAAGVWICEVGPSYGKAVKATAAELEEGLAETTTYLTQHPQVQALVKKAVGNAQAPREKVERLVHFVAGYIEPSYTAQPLTLPDLLKKRQGDCKDYALLFTTLARAAGVPAREVSGLVYMGDSVRAFGPHAWNEVVLDGVWVPVDASRDQTEIDAAHVRFGSDNQGFGALLTNLGTVSFKLLRVERAARQRD